MEQDMAQDRAQHMVRCNNCGTLWFHEVAQAAAGGAEARPVCPVCRFTDDTDGAEPLQVGSVTDLEDQLGALVRNALASGLSSDTIVHVLRDELAFTAELGHTGRRFMVQVIDLGPQEEELLKRPLRDGRDVASNRGNA